MTKRYQRDWVLPDLLAGLTLTAVLVPQALGYAALAGAPAVVGLYTALGAMVLYFFLGTSREPPLRCWWRRDTRAGGLAAPTTPVAGNAATGREHRLLEKLAEN